MLVDHALPLKFHYQISVCGLVLRQRFVAVRLQRCWLAQQTGKKPRGATYWCGRSHISHVIIPNKLSASHTSALSLSGVQFKPHVLSMPAVNMPDVCGTFCVVLRNSTLELFKVRLHTAIRSTTLSFPLIYS